LVNLRTFGSSFLLILIALAAHVGSAQTVDLTTSHTTPAVSALMVSDIHFDPFADPSHVTQLVTAPIAAWETILSEPSPDSAQNYQKLLKDCGSRGPDTSFALLRASLVEMRARDPKAAFVTVSGDLLAHSFECKLQRSLPTVDADGRAAFAAKTIAFIAGQMRLALPGVPIYFALGNNDSDCGDYRLDVRSRFFSAVAQVLTSDVSPSLRHQAVKDFGVAGYYAVDLPAPVRDARLLVVDDTFMAARFVACSGKEDRTGDTLTIDWLSAQLDAARAAHRKLWVMGHIPPAIDVKGSISHGKTSACTSEPKEYLDSEALANKMTESSETIQVGLFGHTHMDEMHLLTASASEKQPSAGNVAIKIVPSISPINGNNPAFLITKIDPNTAQIVDYELIAASGSDPAKIRWGESYDYQLTYHEKAFNSSAMTRLAAEFRADDEAQDPRSQAYIRNFMPGIGAELLRLVWPTYVCALSSQDPASFSHCSCQK
jgi:sphingomyelin phosphodiesterase acid-like 3